MAEQATKSFLHQLTDTLSGPPTLEDELATNLASIIQGGAGDAGLKQQVLGILADAARQVPWRGTFGQAGLLAACSRGLHQGHESEEILKQRLRFIGNCCADNDSNRDIIIETECYSKLVHVIATVLPLRSLATVVMFNFMNEYEPARKHALEHGLIDSLTKIFTETDKQSASAIEYALRCLEIVLHIDVPPNGVVSELINSLLDWANCTSTQLDIFYIVLGCLSALQNDEHTKALSLDPSPIPKYLTLITRLQYWENRLSQVTEQALGDIDTQDTMQLIRSSRGSIIATVSDVSASESFQKQYPPGSALVNLVIEWLNSSDANLLTCAALVLGNMASNAEACTALVNTYQIHRSLVNILKGHSQIAVLHAAGGALKNLVIGSPIIRESVVQAGVLDYCHKFYLASVMIEVQHMGLSLVRILVAASPSNINCLLSPRQGDSRTSAMDKILDLYNENTEAPVRMEVGRIVVSVLREAAKSHPINAVQQEIQQRVFAMSPRIIEPVIGMIVQEKWPAIASEGWFALALFVQTTDGANVLSNLTLSENFFRVLRRVIAPPTSPSNPTSREVPIVSQGPNTKANTPPQKDRENVYMFLSAFLKNHTSQNSQSYEIIFRQFLDGQEVTDTQLEKAFRLQ